MASVSTPLSPIIVQEAVHVAEINTQLDFDYFTIIYPRATSLPDGNVFSGVCLSMVPGERSRVTITHDTLDLTVQTLSHQTIPPWTWGLTVQ